jgi:hypothetical protein
LTSSTICCAKESSSWQVTSTIRWAACRVWG